MNLVNALRAFMVLSMFPAYSFALLTWPALFRFDASSLWMFPAFIFAASVAGRILAIWVKDKPQDLPPELAELKKDAPGDLLASMLKVQKPSQAGLLKSTVMGMEDIIFVLPLFFLDGAAFYFGIVFSSIMFGFAHQQYSTALKISLMAYVPFSYMVAKDVGLLTCVMGHSLTDAVIYVGRAWGREKMLSILGKREMVASKEIVRPDNGVRGEAEKMKARAQ